MMISKFVRYLSLLLVLVATLAATVVLSGVVPAKASSGHWPMTAWMLEFAMERSVSTNSSGIVAPPLDNDALVTRGAGHFEVGCAWCHGQPGSQPSRFVLQMTPHPSVLDEELKKWSPEELFYIVRHGVKFTGMPAWPATERDDEVWSLVAFLERYESLDPINYAELAGLAEVHSARHQQTQGRSIPQIVVDRCVSCHGIDGQGRQAFPVLANQKPAYLLQTLQSYRSGQRPSGTMSPSVAGLTDQELSECVDYFSNLPSVSRVGNLNDDQRQIAETLVQHGDRHRRIGACQACHPADNAAGHDSVAQEYPRLNGQRVDYLVGQLHLFRGQHRGGGANHHIMHNLAEELTDEQILAVAAYYSVQ